MAALTSLNKAYARIEAGDMIAAFGILEDLLRKDPLNIEAWEAFMQICETSEELDYVCEQLLQVSEMNRSDRESVLDYYYFLRQRLMMPVFAGQSPKMITFELVDQFSYSLKNKSVSSGVDHKVINLEQGIAKFLGIAIFIPYIILFAIGLNLMFSGKNFSYWIMMAMAISIFFGVWKLIVRIVENNRKPSG